MDKIALMNSKITVTGHIHRVTWKEEDFQSGGRAILKFDCEEILEGEIPEEIQKNFTDGQKRITLTGRAPSLSLKTLYTVVAVLTEHPRYGLQYHIELMTVPMEIKTQDEARRVLEYVFDETITDILLKELPDPIKVLEQGDTTSLTTIWGIGPFRAEQMIKKYHNNKLKARSFIELYDIGLSRAIIDKLTKAYGSPEASIKAVKNDPYSLIYDVRGIGWKKADEIAKNMKITGNDPRRIKAYLYYILIKNSEDTGNTYMPIDDLVDILCSEIPGSKPDDIKRFLLDFIKNGKLFYEKESRRIGLMENRQTEEKIAQELKRLANASVYIPKNIDMIINQCEHEAGFCYSVEQKLAINNCLTQNISILTALAGSGKTASMFPVAKVMRANYKRVALCALSGKASLNLEEATGIVGRTIHRLLGVEGELGKFKHNAENRLDYDMIILDEASMVDESLFLSLLVAIPDGCKLVLVGDTGQLEPIGLGCVFHDIINSKKFPHVHLTKIFRQAQKSGVITESRRVYDGQRIVAPNSYKTEVRGELQDFKIITLNETNKILYNVIAEYKRFMSEYNATKDEIVVVVGKRAVGDTSARVFNEYIQKIVNPKPTPFDTVVYKTDGSTNYSITFRPNDRVRVTKNCYVTVDTSGAKNPIFNGNIGTIVELWPEKMLVSFPHGEIYIPRANYADLELGYAITCHSAQGSGFPYVITVCDTGSYVLLSKEWLYTAITRSKKFNTLIGQPSAINRACTVDGLKEKKTWLKDLLVDFIK